MKKTIKHHRLSAEERAMFGVMHTVQKSKKDKLNSRQKIKENIKKSLDNME